MPFFNSKKRRSFINPEKDSVSVKAGDRLDRLRSATDQDADARKSGPFVGGLQPAAAGGSASDGQMSLDDHATAAGLHQSLADLYGKYKKPGTDTIPHTTGLTPGEKGELSDEIDMGKE